MTKQRVDARLDGLMRLHHLKKFTKKKLIEPLFDAKEEEPKPVHVKEEESEQATVN